MRVQLDDDERFGDDFVGFMQRARCIVVAKGEGLYEIFLAYDLPTRLANAEVGSYLLIWERNAPGGRVRLVEE